MISEVIIPVMDQTGGEFVLAKWLKHEGEAVMVGDALCEVETNKANVEISAEVAGVLRKVLAPAGAALPSLTVIALIGDAGDPVPEVDPYYRVQRRGASPSAEAPAPAARSEMPAERRGSEVAASPRAKRLASERGIDLSSIVGSGPDGRIVEDDVRKALKPK